jgi:large subunit ribosomal protein L18
MLQIDKKKLRLIRKKRSNNPRGNNERLRVVLTETNRYLIAQAIDDTVGHTHLYHCSQNLAGEGFSKKNKGYAKSLGEFFAQELKKQGNERIVFDRNSRIYHGKVEAFCQAMRASGINF